MDPVQRLTVRGFKSIKDQTVELRPLNVLIGANGSGKSNLIAAFTLLSVIAHGLLQRYVSAEGPASKFLRFGPETTGALVLSAEFEELSYSCTLIPSNDSFEFSSEICEGVIGNEKTKLNLDLGGGHKESRLMKTASTAEGRLARQVLKRLRGWSAYQFDHTIVDHWLKHTPDSPSGSALYSNGSNLAAVLFMLRENYHRNYLNIVETIRQAAPFFDDFVLTPSHLNPSRIALEWRETDSDTHFNAHALSDGTLRFICLTTLLQQPTELMPSTVFIDEPELGLHPFAISLLAAMLQSAATRTQVIVSTQSVALVNQFTPEDLIIVEREERESVFRRLDRADVNRWMDEYGLGDLWEKNVIGGRPRR